MDVIKKAQLSLEKDLLAKIKLDFKGFLQLLVLV